MKNNNELNFAKLMTMLGVIYEKEISECMIEIYWELLGSYPLPEISNAVENHIRDQNVGQFMPKPADLLRHLEDNLTEVANQRWHLVHQTIARIGRYESVQFADPQVNAVIMDLGGWCHLCSLSREALVLRGKDFQQAYVFRCKHDIQPEHDHCVGALGMQSVPVFIENERSLYPLIESDTEQVVTLH